jgi:hypothetical protein
MLSLRPPRGAACGRCAPSPSLLVSAVGLRRARKLGDRQLTSVSVYVARALHRLCSHVEQQPVVINKSVENTRIGHRVARPLLLCPLSWRLLTMLCLLPSGFAVACPCCAARPRRVGWKSKVGISNDGRSGQEILLRTHVVGCDRVGRLDSPLTSSSCCHRALPLLLLFVSAGSCCKIRRSTASRRSESVST